MQPAHQYINLAFLQDFSNGNAQFVQEVLTLAIEQLGEESAKLKVALSEHDHKQVAATCHKLKSTLRFMGLQPQVLDELKHAEQAAAAASAEVPVLTQHIIAMCAQIEQELRSEKH